jgi:enoyl-CoA hydratase/carnithine racemase
LPARLHIDDSGIAEVQLAWPERRNAIGPNDADEIREAFEKGERQGAQVFVLSSQGTTFCAGGDLQQVLNLVKRGDEAVRSTIYASYQGLFRTIRSTSVPVFAAVDGGAVGLGSDLAMACGITYVGDSGWFMQGWAQLGLIPATGGIDFLRKRVGVQGFWQYVVSDRIDANAAGELGLAVAVPDARCAALDAAKRLVQIPGGVVPAMQELLRQEEYERHLDRALELQTQFLLSDHFKTLTSEFLKGKDR